MRHFLAPLEAKGGEETTTAFTQLDQRKVHTRALRQFQRCTSSMGDFLTARLKKTRELFSAASRQETPRKKAGQAA